MTLESTPIPLSVTLQGMGKQKFRITLIRAWRKHRDLSLERVAARIEMTTSNLSKIERGEQPYTQPVLEALAEALNCSPADLLMRPPGTPKEPRNVLLTLIEGLDPETRDQAITVIEALKARKKAA